MSTLSKDLTKISSKMDKVLHLLSDVAHDVMRLEDDYDLLDFSIDHIEGWRANLMDVEMRLEDSINYFNEFAFDGDTIKEDD